MGMVCIAETAGLEVETSKSYRNVKQQTMACLQNVGNNLETQSGKMTIG